MRNHVSSVASGFFLVWSVSWVPCPPPSSHFLCCVSGQGTCLLPSDLCLLCSLPCTYEWSVLSEWNEERMSADTFSAKGSWFASGVPQEYVWRVCTSRWKWRKLVLVYDPGQAVFINPSSTFPQLAHWQAGTQK